MSTAHVCPKCNGEKKVDGKKCPTCVGKGVVFEKDSPKVGDSFTKIALPSEEPNKTIIEKIHYGIRNKILDDLFV